MFGLVTRGDLDRALAFHTRRVLTAIHRLETIAMTGQADFATALSTLTSRFATMQADMQAKLDAAVAAQAAKDAAENAEEKAVADKQFSDAAAGLNDLIAQIPAHVEAAQSATGGNATASATTDAGTTAPAASDAFAATNAGTTGQTN